jgi:1-acyl-sn-glycerol-3-phosphate acyltransferase
MDLTYPPILGAARAMFGALNLSFDTSGGQYLPTRGGAVLASTHVSYLDFIFCGLAARRSKRLVRFMAKKSTFDNPVSGLIMKSMHHIPVDRASGSGSYDEALSALRDDQVVGVFPEATISQSFEPKDFKTGAVRLAAEAGVPLVPMVTFGGQRLWTKGHERTMDRGTTISLFVGKPMAPSEDSDPDVATQQLKDRILDLYDRMIERYPDAPASSDAADTWWWPARFGGGAPTPEQMRKQESADRKAREERRP